MVVTSKYLSIYLSVLSPRIGNAPRHIEDIKVLLMVPIDPWQNSSPFYDAKKIDNFSHNLKMKMTKNMKTIKNLDNLKNKDDLEMKTATKMKTT